MPGTAAPPGSSPKARSRAALITGAAGGLGEAVTRAFLDSGCSVAATYRGESDAEALRRLAAGRALLPIEVDATNVIDMKSAVLAAQEAFDQVDYLIALVGGWAGGKPVWETSAEEWDRMLAVNLRSAYAACHAALPGIAERRYGRVVLVSSRSAVQPSPGAAAYATAKAGVVSLTETLAQEVREAGDITVNCVLPSVIDTPANRKAMPKADPSRWVTPKQLASIILWLTSDDAAPINGASIPVYGRA